MNLFVERHQNLLKLLLEVEVEFIVIGGYSVIFHGYPRTTGDVDLWIKPDSSSKGKILPVLKKIGIDKKSIQAISELDFTGYLVFTIWEKPERVDFLTRINLITFEEANLQKIVADVGGLKIPFLHLNHLVLSKMNTGRPKDAADINELQKIQKLKKNKKK